MPNIEAKVIEELQAIVGAGQVITETGALLHGSRDFYWFSPVLKPKLDAKSADAIVRPQSVEALSAVVSLAVKMGIPLTPRGAGTGNYGQSVPMQGGIVLNLKDLDEILDVSPQAMRVQTGTLLITMEEEARTVGAELRFFPSTIQTATAGGFLAGGSGGVGSVTWGTLWDEGNVLAATIMTIEADPQLLTVSGVTDLQAVIHNCGLSCLIVDLTLSLAPSRAWSQTVAAFDSLDQALAFGESLAYDDLVQKRLVSVLDWPIPSYFRQLVRDGACPEGRSLALLQLTMSQEELARRAAPYSGQLTWHSPPEHYLRKGWQLSDFSWNHTTLWVMKTDNSITYLQDQFDRDRLYEQTRLRRERFGADIMEHIEFMKWQGRVVPQGLGLVRYRSAQQLQMVMNYCESIGIWIANPHTHYLDEDVRWNGQPILDARQRWDPQGLLNPGHLRSLEGANPT